MRPASPTPSGSRVGIRLGGRGLAVGRRHPVAPAAACTPAHDPEAHDWTDRVLYEVFVRSFADSDGDGIGDLRGLTSKLDYLNDGDPATTDDLGVTGLWLMPIAESPSYHGYDVTDYEAVERRLRHARGPRGVPRRGPRARHRGDRRLRASTTARVDHPWFTDSARGADDTATGTCGRTTQPTWLGPDGQRVWHERDGRFYYGVFWEGMPDLNLAQPGR